jgi:putative DNA primase/helicase
MKWLRGHTPKLDDLFTSVANRFLDLLEFPVDDAFGTAYTLALWAMLTYVYPIWGAVPYLSVGGSLSSGKSRLLEVLGLLVCNPIHSSNLTAPSLFRTLHTQGGAVLFDEAERLNDRTPDAGEVRSILLAGYKRGGQAMRLEKVGDGFQSTAFDVYGPKAIAGISSMPAALVSRCIRIMMFRAGKNSPVPRRRIDPLASTWKDLRDDLHCMAMVYGARLTAMAGWQPDCERLNGRNLELWLPVLAIATVIEEAGLKGLVAEVERHAIKSMESAHEDAIPELDEVLLRSLRRMLEDKPWGITPGALLEAVIAEEPSLCPRHTPRGISTILTRYGIKTGRTGGKRLLRVDDHQWKAIEASYGVDLTADGSEEANGSK